MKVVRFLTEENHDPYNRDKQASKDKSWHYIWSPDGADRAICSGQVFGYGEADIEYETKEGKITCPSCIAVIKMIKAIKL
jgi:hypothetical protein